MLLINITEAELRNHVDLFNNMTDSSVEIVNLQDKSTGRRNAVRCRFVPRFSADKYGRLSHSGRRIKALCWHGHRDLFRFLFQARADLEIRTARATYKGLDGFEAEYPATGDHNIGMQCNPVRYKDACECLDWS